MATMFFPISTGLCTYNRETRCHKYVSEGLFTMGKFATFFIGGIIGVAAGMLLSPRTGAENRAMIAETINEGKIEIPPHVQEKAGQIADTAASTSQKVINTVIDNSSDAYKAVTARVQQAIPANQVDISGDELRQKIDAARERIATQVAKNAEVARDAAVDKIPVVIDAAQGATKSAKTAAHTASQAVSDVAATAKEAVSDAAASVSAKINPSDKAETADQQ